MENVTAGNPAAEKLTAGPVVSEVENRALAAGIVAFTRRSARRFNRSRVSVGDLFLDLYSNVLALGCVLTVAASFILALRHEIADRDLTGRGLLDDEWLILPGQVLWTLVSWAALAAMTALARKLGPITVSGPEGDWWLPLPVDRRPMVLPRFLRRCVLTGAGSAAAFLPFSFLTSLERTPAGHLLAAATFGAASVVAVGLAAVLQLGILNHRFARIVSAALLLPYAALSCLGSSPWAPLLALASAFALISAIAPRAGLVRGAELIRGGAVSGHASASLYFIDTNEMRRAFTGAQPVDAGSGSKFYARAARGPIQALLRADIVAFIRLHPPLTPPIFWLGACAAVLLVEDGLPAFVQLAVIALGACATASGAGTVARRTALLPELDALLPLPPSIVRACRTLMPAIALALWMALLSALLALMGAAGPGLILVGALSGAGMGAGAIRGASRPAPDWSAPPVETPFGPVPRAQLTSLLRGLDVTILALIPLIAALYLGNVHPALVIVQAVISLGIFLSVVLPSHGATTSGHR